MNKNTKLAIASLLVSLIVLALKTKAYYVTQSVSVLSDALETVINVVTALVALYAIHFASKPADDDHPYGHGKLEYFSAAFEGGLIFFAAMAIIVKAVDSFFSESQIANIITGNIYLIAATLINLAAGSTLVFYGKQNKSEALRASGKHILSDVITSVVILFGLYIVQLTGIKTIDSIMALAAGFWLLFEAYQIIKFNSSALLDAVDPDSISDLAAVINKHKTAEIINIHNLRIIRSGNFHHIDAHLVLPQFLDVATAHHISEQFEQKVVKDYKFEGEFAFHVDPCKQKYCSTCAMSDCKIRQAEFISLQVETIDTLVKGPMS